MNTPMYTSIFLAKLFGPYCLIVATGVLLNQKAYRKVMEDIIQNSAIIYIAGVIALIFGLLTVLVHNVWVVSWPVMITLLGWIALLKGVWIIVFPGSLAKVTSYHLNNPFLLAVRLSVVLLAGIALTVFGYFVRFP